jgi:hypothetical protein
VPFEGDLKVVSLESVLRNIDANSLTGILTIKDARGERQVAFQGGRIVAVLPVAGEERSVPDALAKKGFIAKDDVEKVRTSLAWKRMNLRRALEYRGLVKETDYVQAVRDEVIVPLFVELFTNRDRTFRFDESDDNTPSEIRKGWDEDQLAGELRVSIESVVLECVKRIDEKGPEKPPAPENQAQENRA